MAVNKVRDRLDELQAQIRKLAERFDNCLLYTSPSPRDA